MKILFSSFALLLFLWFSFRRRIFFLPFHIRSQPSLLFGDQLNEHVQAPLLFPSVPSAFHSYNSALHRYPLPRIIEKRRTTRAFYFLSSLFCSFARICLPSCSGCSPLSQAQLIRFNWKSSAMLSIRALLSRFSRFFPKHIFLYVEVKNRIQKVFFQATKRRTKVPRNSTWNQDFSNINAYKLTSLVTFSEKWCTLFVPFFFLGNCERWCRSFFDYTSFYSPLFPVFLSITRRMVLATNPMKQRALMKKRNGTGSGNIDRPQIFSW